MKLLLPVVFISLLLVASSQLFADENSDLDNLERQAQIQKLKLHMINAERDSEHQRQMRDLEVRQREFEVENLGKMPHHRMPIRRPVLFAFIVLVHILATIWVYQDINRTKVSPIWIVIALLAGLVGTLVYAVIRIPELSNSRNES